MRKNLKQKVFEQEDQPLKENIDDDENMTVEETDVNEKPKKMNKRVTLR